MWELTEHEPSIRVLIRDKDKKFTSAFDLVLRGEGMDVILTPILAQCERLVDRAEWYVATKFLPDTTP